jgi:general secretion pathway protein J
MRKINEFPLLFSGERDELRYAAALPPRVASGGIWFYRLAILRNDARTPLVLERSLPDLNALEMPTLSEPERSVLAQDIASLKITYFGRDPGVNDQSAPTWRDRWEDTQRLPTLIRIEIEPKRGAPWPPLIVAPREAPEAGCRAWDIARFRCAAI